MNASFRWTRRRRDLVTELLGVLFGIIHEWETFLSPDGDWGYFSDLDRFPSNSPEFRAAGQVLRSIKRAFKRLEYDRQKLLSLKETLSDDLSTASSTMTLPDISPLVSHSLIESLAETSVVTRRQRSNRDLGIHVKVHNLGMIRRFFVSNGVC
jgi:hypothetical protein